MYVEKSELSPPLRHRILLQLDEFLTLFDAFRRPYLTGRATIGRLELPPGEGRFHGRFVEDPPLRATPPPRITAYTRYPGRVLLCMDTLLEPWPRQLDRKLDSYSTG